MPGDYNGDGVTRFSVFRPSLGRWYIRGADYVTFGQKGDIPFPLDSNGDGTFERALFRPSEGRWHIYAFTDAAFGAFSDQPLAGASY